MCADVSIRKFNPKMVPDLGVVVFVGRSGSGKTVAITDLLYSKRKRFDRFLVMSGSSDTAAHFAQFVPPICVFEGFDEQRINNIYLEQEANVARGLCKPILIILDDLMYQSRVLEKSEVMNRIFMNGRHAQILLFISMQYCKSLGPQLRQQATFIFATREKNPENRGRLYESFNTVFHSRAEFDAVFNACTQNREVLVLSNTFNESDAIEDNAFWWKAKLRKKFKVNRKSAAWALSKQLFDKEYMLREHQQPKACIPKPGPKNTRVINFNMGLPQSSLLSTATKAKVAKKK
jgi:hypothetical protein